MHHACAGVRLRTCKHTERRACLCQSAVCEGASKFMQLALARDPSLHDAKYAKFTQLMAQA
eukprot:10859268-Alexandrium_andersonii.AAC.1